MNIAEGSTSQSDAEQARFLGLAIRSLIETVACQHLANRRGYFQDPTPLRNAYRHSKKLFIKLQAFRTSHRKKSDPRFGEEPRLYDADNEDEGTPF